MRIAVRRMGAWLIDCGCILIWAAATFGGFTVLYRAGLPRPRNQLVLNLIAALVLVVPVVLAATLAESRGGAATLGKRVLGLSVRTDAGDPGIRHALLRNALKIGIPWLIGHAAVFELSAGGSGSQRVPVGVWILTAAAYALPVIYVASLFVGDGRTPYDRIAGTRVTMRL